MPVCPVGHLVLDPYFLGPAAFQQWCQYQACCCHIPELCLVPNFRMDSAWIHVVMEEIRSQGEYITKLCPAETADTCKQTNMPSPDICWKSRLCNSALLRFLLYNENLHIKAVTVLILPVSSLTGKPNINHHFVNIAYLSQLTEHSYNQSKWHLWSHLYTQLWRRITAERSETINLHTN